MKRMSTRVFSKNEEIAHVITHGVGVLFSLIALYFLVVFSYASGDTVLLISVVIFGVSMLFMYVSSTLVHSLPQGKWKNIFLIIDHAAIYILFLEHTILLASSFLDRKNTRLNFSH